MNSSSKKRENTRPRLGQPKNLKFLRQFWMMVIPLLGYWAYTYSNRPAIFSWVTLLVAFFSLLPAYLWCRGLVGGLPIFPFYAGAFLLTHANQFLMAEPRLREYPADSILRAALTVSAFLLVTTLVWLFWVKRQHFLPMRCRVLEEQRGTSFLLIMLAISSVVTLFSHAGWLAQLPSGLVTLVTQFFRGPTSFFIFILAMRWGRRTLSLSQTAWFIGLFISYCIIDATSLFLVSVVVMSLMLVLGFILGREAVPWLWVLPMVVIIGLLHIGKGEMRSRYWEEGTQGSGVKPWAYPSLYGEWIQASLKQLAAQKHEEEEAQSIFSRLNTINLLLQAQEMAPKEVPFLHGETYAIIPSAIMPRIFDSEKASPHYSTSLLNVHFGNHTWESAKSTSIGWGLLNEAYANFGYMGCLFLAVILGTFYGLITHFGIGMPVSSLATLVGIFTLGFALQTEMTAAIFITAYLQGLFALLLMSWPFTTSVRLRAKMGKTEVN